MASDPKIYKFDVTNDSRPTDVIIPETWYLGIRNYWSACTGQRDVHLIEGIKTVLIYATAESSSERAVSVMKEGKFPLACFR